MKAADKKVNIHLICFLIVLAFFQFNLSNAQSNIEFKTLTFPELSQNQVNEIVQDKKGSLWLATYNGVFRYDGYQIEQLIATNATGESLPVGPSNHLFITREDHLWIVYQNEALVDFDLKTTRFEVYRHKVADVHSIASNVINSIVEDSKGQLWFATFNGLDCFDKNTKKFIHFEKHSHGLDTDSLSTLCVDQYDNLYVGTEQNKNGLYYFDKTKMVFNKIFKAAKIDDFYYVRFLTMDQDNNVWCDNDGCTFVLDHKSKIIKPVIGSFEHNMESQIIGSGPIMVSKDLVWIGSYTGLYIYNQQTHRTIHFEHNDVDLTSINSNRILCLFKDRSENIWIGTDNGLMKLSKVQVQIHVAKHLISEQGYLRKKPVRSLWVDPKDHTIWQGTSGEGLQKLNQDGTWSQYLFNPHYSQYGYNYINDIRLLRNGSLALATERGLQIFNTKTNTFIANKFNIPDTDKIFIERPLWNIWEDEKEVLWLGFKFNGLYLYDFSKNSLQRIDSTKKNLSIWFIYNDQFRKQIVWLGTNKGLYYIDRSKIPFQINSASFIKENKEIGGENIFLIHQDKIGNLWLSTVGKGLLKYTPGKGELRQFSTIQGLPSNMISGILEDRVGHLWISSANGIFVFDPLSERVIREYNDLDGFSSTRFNFKSCFELPDGEMFFGSSDGVNFFNPDSIKINTYQPRLFITSFKTLYNERVQDLSLDSTVTLPYNQNSFAIEYASDDYTNPGKNTFSYQLAGFSTDWSKPDPRHYTAFTNLGPGKYIFKVRGANSDGLWGEKVLILRITILPPFWQTWWFYSICIIFLMGVLFYFVNDFVQKRDLKRKKIYAELAALRMQLNPHFVFNSLTSLEHFIVLNQNKLAIDYLVKFSRLMRMILENSAEEFILLWQEIDFLELYIFMESLRLKDKVIFEIIPDPALDMDHCYIPPMLLQPIIENAIIHGVSANKKEGRIIISFIAEKDGFIAKVEDNGVGWETAVRNKTAFGEAKKSVGLKIVKDRINIIRQMYGEYAGIAITEIKEEGNSGTKVEIKIPYIHESKPAKNQIPYS